MRIASAARGFTIVLGCMGVLWGAITFPRFWRDSAVEQVAQRILTGEPFRLQDLVERIPGMDAIEQESRCRPAALRSDAIIRLRIAENTLAAADGAHIDERMAALRGAVIRSLACSPSDSFLWLGLYWVNVAINGFRPSDVKYLRMSYELGPNEGWIIVKRNQLALAIFPQLPSDLAERALAEFARLLEPGFVPFAADIFVGPGWPIRNLLLARIEKSPESQRQFFSNILRAKGYEIAVPGITQKERPWL